MTSGVLEGTVLTLAAILADVRLTRARVPAHLLGYAFDFADVVALYSMTWLVLVLAKGHRAGLGPVLRRTRLALAGWAGAIPAGFLDMAVGTLSPLLAPSCNGLGALVSGPWLLDTLALAYSLPALTHLTAAWRLALLRGLCIVHLTSGSILALLLPGGDPSLLARRLAGHPWRGIARRSHLLRRIAMTIIGLVIAKVFLIDAAGLTGLTRIFSFPGLSLASLAWVNRWADH